MSRRIVIAGISLVIFLGVTALAFTQPWVSHVLFNLIPQDWYYEKGELDPLDKIESDSQQPYSIGLIPDLGLLLVPFQEKLGEDMFYAPCPLSPQLEQKIFSATQPIGFDDEPNKRQWEDIRKACETSTDLQALMGEMRKLLMAYYGFQHENSGLIFGLSGTTDYIAATKVCICDHLSLIHHHVRGGIDPAIDVDNPETQILSVTPAQREALHLVYRSCKMTTLNAHRFEGGWYTRVAYEPTPSDEKRINELFNIDPKRPNEVICCYKKVDDASPKDKSE